MPLGDSITWDDRIGDNRTDGERISYRYRLWQLLTDAGYDFDFVGSQYTGYDIFPDAENEGHPGWTDDDIAASVYDFLLDNPAEIILLHIGTNDFGPDPGGVKDILDEIDRYEADFGINITVILARIINRSNYHSGTTLFNDNVEELAFSRVNIITDPAYPDRIIFGAQVDMEDGAGIDYNLITDNPPGDMWDNLHPSETGYSKMADVWFFALIDILPVPDGCYLYQRFEETTLTEGIEYYTDRTYTLTNVPSKFLGLDMIKTPNDDRFRENGNGYLTFEMPSDGTVYVGVDGRASSVPDWLNGFTYTGDRIYTSLSTQPYLEVYSRTYTAGECVDLGGNFGPGSSSENRSNYIMFYGTISGCALDARFEETTLAEGIEYYTDRTYTLTNVPSKFFGLDMIKTPNDDRFRENGNGYLTFEMPSDGTVYVGIDGRASSVPDWLNGFTYTGDRIYTSLSTQPYLEVYSRTYTAGECVDLGGNFGPGSSSENRSNYIVFFEP